MHKNGDEVPVFGWARCHSSLSPEEEPTFEWFAGRTMQVIDVNGSGRVLRDTITGKVYDVHCLQTRSPSDAFSHPHSTASSVNAIIAQILRHPVTAGNQKYINEVQNFGRIYGYVTRAHLDALERLLEQVRQRIPYADGEAS